jgi:S-formylglutathione hydrolase
MSLDTISVTRAHGGTQHVVKHASRETDTDMTFSVYLPPAAHEEGASCPVVWYLSGLTCTHANVTEKGEYRAACAELGLVFVAPDTSPRGPGVPDHPDYDLGQGAGFYLDAQAEPWRRHFRMESYIADELPEVVASAFPIDLSRQAIMGHSMGGHGALTLALRRPGIFKSVSAFAPIVAPSQVPWGRKAFAAYLGADETEWEAHDAWAMMSRGQTLPALLVDFGAADPFLDEQLKPELLENLDTDFPVTLRIHPGYDHSYYFISTFMAEHLRWHAARLDAIA